MKCPACGSAASVLATRHRGDFVTYRRYECFDQHRFSTLEQPTDLPQSADTQEHWTKRSLRQRLTEMQSHTAHAHDASVAPRATNNTCGR